MRAGSGSLDIRVGSQADLLQVAFAKQVQRPFFTQTALRLQKEQDLPLGIQAIILVEDFKNLLHARHHPTRLIEFPARNARRFEPFFPPSQQPAGVEPFQHRGFGNLDSLRFQGLPNQLAANPHSAIIGLRRRVADEICDRRLLPLRFLLCYAGFHANSIEEQYRKIRFGRFKKCKIARQIELTEGWLSG